MKSNQKILELFRVLVVLSAIIKAICSFYWYLGNEIVISAMWFSGMYLSVSVADYSFVMELPYSDYAFILGVVIAGISVILAVCFPIFFLINNKKMAIISTVMYIIALSADIITFTINYFEHILNYKLLGILINIIFVAITIYYNKLLRIKQESME